MAQCVSETRKKTAVDDTDLMVLDSQPPIPKRLKQGRLSFKPSSPLTPLAVINNSANKKRKLSGQDSPNSKAKQPKVPDLRSSLEKASKVQNDNEVSSSSEAENQALLSAKARSSKSNLLEKFVRREDEITSTNDVIDLTDSQEVNEPDENILVKTRSPKRPATKPAASDVQKEKSEEHFARRLTFDEAEPASQVESVSESEKVDIQNVSQTESVSESEKDDIQNVSQIESTSEGEKGDVLSVSQIESTSEKVDVQNVCQIETASEKVDVQNVSQLETASEKVDAPLPEITSNKDEEDIPMDVEAESVDDVNKEVADNAAEADKSVASDKCSEEEESPKAKKKAKTSSVKKTPVRKAVRLSTSTPKTSEPLNTSGSSGDGATPTSENKKALSKKQLERAAMRQKVKEEKEQEKQQAKELKEKERLEKKKQRDEEKAEKEKAKNQEKEMKEKERLEKKDALEKERLEKLQVKEEEKKKKQEQIDAKEEERKKKDEEKKQKEEQKLKEEEEKQKISLKRKAAFTSFFIKPAVVTSTKTEKAVDKLFIPFAVKKDMSLAPVIRDELSAERKNHLDEAMMNEAGAVNYLTQLGKDGRKPVRSCRVLREKTQAEDDDEVMVVHDSEAVKKVMHAVKLLQFHTDYRPPYYGTWRKKPVGLKPRNPWTKDEGVFDYEVDSDDEWEEEEPGESLSDSNGEDEDGEEEEEGTEEDGWMVPHGYLSEDECVDEDEEVTPETLKARQRAKALAWERELKAKREVAPPLFFGCYLLDNPCTDAKHLQVLQQYQMICLRSSPVDTLISRPKIENDERTADKTTSKGTPATKGCRKRALPEEAMPDLIRLVHGNPCGIKKLVREFRMFWRQKSADPNQSINDSQDNGADALEESILDTSAVLDSAGDAKEGEKAGQQSAGSPTEKSNTPAAKSDENLREADATPSKTQNDSMVGDETSDSCVSKRQLEMKIVAIALREKREGKKRCCWYVKTDVLLKYKMTDQPVENTWAYVSGEIRKMVNKSAEKDTPNKPVADKKTPNKSAQGKKTPGKCPVKKVGPGSDGSKPEEEEALTTPAKEEAPDADGTPKAGRSKKEASTKKTLKDQPSIMAFARKGNVSAKKELVKSDSKESTVTKDVVIVDVDIDMQDEPKPTASKDQPSILAFARKGNVSAKKELVKSDSKEGTASKDNDIVDVDMQDEPKPTASKDQPSILAFARKTNVSAKKELMKSDNKESTASTDVDVDMQDETKPTASKDDVEMKEETKSTHVPEQASPQVTEEHSSRMNDGDCIVID